MANAQNSRLLPIADLDGPFIQAHYADVGMRRHQIDIDEIFPRLHGASGLLVQDVEDVPGVWIVGPAAFHVQVSDDFLGRPIGIVDVEMLALLVQTHPRSLEFSFADQPPQAVATIIPSLGALQLVNHREIAPLAPEDMASPVHSIVPDSLSLH